MTTSTPARRLAVLGIAVTAAASLSACPASGPAGPASSQTGSGTGSAVRTDPGGEQVTGDATATGSPGALPFGATPRGQLAWTVLPRDPVDQQEFQQLEATQPQEQRWQSGNGCVLNLYAGTLTAGAPQGDDQTGSRAMNKTITDVAARKNGGTAGPPRTLEIGTGGDTTPADGTVSFVASTTTTPHGTYVIATRTFGGKHVMQAVTACTGTGHEKAARNTLMALRVVQK